MEIDNRHLWRPSQHNIHEKPGNDFIADSTLPDFITSTKNILFFFEKAGKIQDPSFLV